MKFISLLSTVLVFALPAAYAEKEPAVLLFLPAPRVFPPEYRIRADFRNSRTSHEIILRTKEPNWLAAYPQRSSGFVDYDQLPGGRYSAVINDNNAKGGDKSLRIDFRRPGAEFHYEGTSVIDEIVDDIPADGYVRPFDDDFFGYRSSRFYRNQDRHCY